MSCNQWVLHVVSVWLCFGADVSSLCWLMFTLISVWTHLTQSGVSGWLEVSATVHHPLLLPHGVFGEPEQLLADAGGVGAVGSGAASHGSSGHSGSHSGDQLRCSRREVSLSVSAAQLGMGSSLRREVLTRCKSEKKLRVRYMSTGGNRSAVLRLSTWYLMNTVQSSESGVKWFLLCLSQNGAHLFDGWV